MLAHTLETEIGGKKIGDRTSRDVAELTCLAVPDFRVLADIAKAEIPPG